MPKVTVLLPVHNGEKYIRASIESILAQEFGDFSLLVVDDGSTDKTNAILRSMGDARLRIIENRENLGLIGSLNKGISLIESEYIARMDADDVALPRRLGSQVAFLDAHPDVGVVGSYISILNSSRIIAYPISDSAIKVALLDNSPFAHPSVMYRSALLRRTPYDEGFKHAEDFRLWVELAGRTRMANIPEPLLAYRLHENQITARHSVHITQIRMRIISDYLEKIVGRPISRRELYTHAVLLGSSGAAPRAEIEAWVELLRAHGSSSGIWQDGDFERFVGGKYLGLLDRTIDYKVRRKVAAAAQRLGLGTSGPNKKEES